MPDEPIGPGFGPRPGGPTIGQQPDPIPRGEREVETETVASTVYREPPDAEPEGEGQADQNPQPNDDVPLPVVEVQRETAHVAAGTPEVEGVDAGTVLADLRTPEPTHGRLKTWAIVTVAAAALAMLGFALTYSPLFAAHTVRVEGVDHLTVAQVQRIARIRSGVNVFRLDTELAERRLERNVWVADAEITTELPSAVRIVVRERTPAAIAVTDVSGARSLVAEDGTILAGARGPVGLPFVQASDGATVPSEAQRMLGAAVAGSLPGSIVAQVETVAVGGDGSVELILAGGVLVSYGDDSALAAKGQALRAVLLWAEREGPLIASVDVRTPGAPTARLGGGATVSPLP